jgi:hypothetical protein
MRTQRQTFSQILEASRVQAATAAWDRARLASRLRHYFVAMGKGRSGRMMGQLKNRCLTRAAEILPNEVRVTIDTDYQIGLVSVRWPGHGRLHLAPASLMNRTA